MIIVMGKDVTDAQIGAVVKKLEAAGLQANISRGIERTVIGAIGDERPLSEEMFTPLPGVESAMHIAKQYKIVSRESHKENTVSWAAIRSRSSPGRVRWRHKSRWTCRQSSCMRQVAA
jgi:3-deoxy-7-phosphoheptulonate synthase